MLLILGFGNKTDKAMEKLLLFVRFPEWGGNTEDRGVECDSPGFTIFIFFPV